jgi:hypothetical protein
MTTTIYQKYVSRYSEVFTLVCIDYGDDEYMEITPHAKAQEILYRSVAEFSELVAELQFWQNEKASWED